MTLETIFIFAMSLILLWIKPGPNQAFKITRTLNDGFAAGFYFVLGVITACVIFFLIAALGLKILNDFFNGWDQILKIMGAIYLLYIGYKGLRNIKRGQWQGRVDKSNKRKFVENYPAALLLTFANPLAIFYFLGIMPILVPVGNFQIHDIITGACIIITVGLVVDSILLLLVGQIKEALSDTKFVKRLNLFTSIGFLLIGLFLLYSSLFMGDFSFSMI